MRMPGDELVAQPHIFIPADYVMASGMLRGIKRRAESGAMPRSSGRSPATARHAAAK
jgi:hypothetical protein